MNSKLSYPKLKLSFHLETRKQESFPSEGTLHYIDHTLEKVVSNKDQTT